MRIFIFPSLLWHSRSVKVSPLKSPVLKIWSFLVKHHSSGRVSSLVSILFSGLRYNTKIRPKILRDMNIWPKKCIGLMPPRKIGTSSIWKPDKIYLFPCWDREVQLYVHWWIFQVEFHHKYQCTMGSLCVLRSNLHLFYEHNIFYFQFQLQICKIVSAFKTFL